MRKVFGVAALMLTLSLPTFAGIIHNPAPQPAAPPTQETSASGLIHTPASTIDAALSILSGLLALF